MANKDKTNQKGLFVSFEGIDGCGKSTQLTKVKNELANMSYDIITTREPGGTTVGDAVRDILLSSEYHTMTIETEILLYAASRVQHVDEIILPALEQGKIVLCDRFLDSSLAYQGAKFSRESVSQYNKLAWEKVMPSLTFLIDIDPGQAFERVGDNKDRIEIRGLNFQEQVRRNYLYLAEQECDRIVVVDGNRSEQEVFAIIWEKLYRVLSQRNGMTK